MSKHVRSVTMKGGSPSTRVKRRSRWLAPHLVGDSHGPPPGSARDPKQNLRQGVKHIRCQCCRVTVAYQRPMPTHENGPPRMATLVSHQQGQRASLALCHRDRIAPCGVTALLALQSRRGRQSEAALSQAVCRNRVAFPSPDSGFCRCMVTLSRYTACPLAYWPGGQQISPKWLMSCCQRCGILVARVTGRSADEPCSCFSVRE